MMRIILVLASALASTALAAGGPRESEADSVREVAFKTLIDEAAQKGYKVYFLSFGSTWTNGRRSRIDPPDGFMKRFQGGTPPVKKVSQSKMGEGNEVRDKSSGQRGVIFTVTDLKWVSDHEVEATCSVFRDGLDAFTFKYTLVGQNHQWTVTDKKWIRMS